MLISWPMLGRSSASFYCHRHDDCRQCHNHDYCHWYHDHHSHWTGCDIHLHQCCPTVAKFQRWWHLHYRNYWFTIPNITNIYVGMCQFMMWEWIYSLQATGWTLRMGSDISQNRSRVVVIVILASWRTSNKWKCRLCHWPCFQIEGHISNVMFNGNSTQ